MFSERYTKLCPLWFPAFLKESGLLEGPKGANKEAWGPLNNKVT